MDALAALRSRRSCRDFLPDPLDPADLRLVLDAARRGPTAGNSWGLDLLVLEGPDEVGGYWDTTLPVERRAAFPWPGLLRAPVLVIPVVDPAAYVERYAQPDKAPSGLGEGTDAWAVPYWWVDAGAAVMAMLVAAESLGLGALLFGQFGHTGAVAERFGIPSDRLAVGTVALGRPAGDPDRSRSASVEQRRRPPLDRIVHRGGW